MRTKMMLGALAGAVLTLGLMTALPGDAGKNASSGQAISHDVFFTLKDPSEAQVQKLIDACYKYLTKHEGEVFFSAGPLVKELKREVNDFDFHVGLHIVFKDRAAHDRYQDHPRHDQFIQENKENWKKVRVFDSYVAR